MDHPDARVSTPITVFLLDDHEIVRRGLIDLLGTTTDITVVGEAATAAEALRRIPAVRPDVAVLDARLPDGSGIDVCREIRSEPSRHPLPHPHLLRRRRGPVRRGDGRRRRLPAQGDPRPALSTPSGRSPPAGPCSTPRSPDAAERLRHRQQPRSAAQLADRREREILDLIAEGLTNRQIGERLFLAEKTVKNYVSALLSKLGMQRRTQAAVFGAELRQTPGPKTTD